MVPAQWVEHFRGTFLVVDITGVWNENDHRLKPIIVECQPGGSLSGMHQIDPNGYHTIRDACVTQINCALHLVKNSHA